jgi:CubicO group peptidase (beta-lactamase class C family)
LIQYHRVVRLDKAVDQFSELADQLRLGIEGIQVDLDDGQSVERRWIADIRRDVFSVSKTVTSLAIGMLEHEELLKLDDSVLSHLPRLADTAAPGVEAMTVRHLLSMTAGNGYRWLDEDADHPGDPARDFLATPLISEPGTHYDYRGGNSYVLGRIVHSVSGQDLREFLLPRLFSPLEIRNPQWLRCPLGFPLGAIGLQLRTSEVAKIAQVLLHGGLHQGDRLVSADYIARMISETTATGRAEPDNEIYGLHVWLCSRDHAWRMDGLYGQFGIVLPESHACVSVTAHYEGPTTDILDAVWDRIVPALT